MKNELRELFADRLRVAMAARDVDVLALSEAIGVSRQAVSAYCGARMLPRLETLRLISDKLDVPSDYLIGHDDSAVEKAKRYDEIEKIVKGYRK